MGHFDVNKICEDVFCGVFKELYGFENLRNHFLLNTRDDTSALYNLAEDVHRRSDIAGERSSVCDQLAGMIASRPSMSVR